jgi:hypothetical protein
MTVVPKCKALLICRQARYHKLTGELDLLGATIGLWIDKIPGVTPAKVLYIQLSDVVGQPELVIRLSDLGSGEAVFEVTPYHVQHTDRLAPTHVFMRLDPFTVERAGRYDVIVLTPGGEVDRQAFEVRERSND